MFDESVMIQKYVLQTFNEYVMIQKMHFPAQTTILRDDFSLFVQQTDTHLKQG